MPMSRGAAGASGRYCARRAVQSGRVPRRGRPGAATAARPARACGLRRKWDQKASPACAGANRCSRTGATCGTSCDREGFPLEADLHNSALKPICPGVFQLGSEVTRSACRTPQATRGPLYTNQSSSCWPFSRAPSTRSRRVRTRPTTSFSSFASRPFRRISSLARFRATMTAMRS